MELVQANSESAETVIGHQVSLPVEFDILGRPSKGKWPEEEERRAVELLKAGHSCASIGEQLGRSRNSVIGKMHRLGLLGSPEDGRRRVPSYTVGTGFRRPATHRAPDITRLKKLRHAKTATVEPVGHNCLLDELSNTTCRWPFDGSQGFFYCGSPEADFAGGIPYCPYHCKVAYLSPKKEAA